MDNEKIIEEIHLKVLGLQHKVVELENSKFVLKQDKLLAFKFISDNEKQFFVSGNINGLLTLIRTLIQSLVLYGNTRKKIDTLKFPQDVLTNSDYFLNGINVVDDFFEIEKIKTYEPTSKEKMKFLALHLWSMSWKMIKIGLMILGVCYIIQITLFE